MQVSHNDQHQWTGLGRWLSFGLAALLIAIAIPGVLDGAGAAAGWNIFLGLLLFGAVASGNSKAPLLALLLTALMTLRLLLAIIAGGNFLAFWLGAVSTALAGIAAYDLREQALLKRD